MKEQKYSYSQRIGKTTFIVNNQSEVRTPHGQGGCSDGTGKRKHVEM